MKDGANFKYCSLLLACVIYTHIISFIHSSLHSFIQSFISVFIQSVIPADDVNITLITDSSTNEMRVGSKVKFTVEIVFPLGDTDMLVELFTPDNETTVMILCAAEVRSVGANLSPSVGTPTVVIESKEDDTIKKVGDLPPAGT